MSIPSLKCVYMILKDVYMQSKVCIDLGYDTRFIVMRSLKCL